MSKFTGIYAPIPTPFLEDERIAFNKLESNLSKWLIEPLEGIVVPGSNSEAVFLSTAERLKIWDVCAEVYAGSGKHFITGTGAETTKESLYFIQQAAMRKASAALVLPPHFYVSQMSRKVLVQHYYTLADNSEIPLLIYNIPAFTGIDFSLDTLIEIAGHPNVIGIKDSSSNVIKMSGLLQALPGFQVLAGTGSALLPFLSIGAQGGVMALANFAASPLADLYKAFHRHDLKHAQQMQHALVSLNTAVTSGYGVPGLKHALELSGFYGGPCRKPLLPLDEDARNEIEQLMEAIFPDEIG